MWARNAKLSIGHYVGEGFSGREFGTWSCVSHQFNSATRRPVAVLHNSVMKADVCLVGIDHVSSKSVECVRTVIRQFKPDVVAVELCMRRAATALSSRKPEKMGWRDVLSLKGSLKEKVFHFAINSLYAHVAETDGGSWPGEEMRVAVKEGRALGARIMAIDRDINVTISRASGQISALELLRLYFGLKDAMKQYPKLYEAVSKIADDFSIRKLTQQIEIFFEPGVTEEALKFGDDSFPGLMRALIHERNEYMVRQLRKMDGRVVGVVGSGHLPGMCKLWYDSEDQTKK